MSLSLRWYGQCADRSFCSSHKVAHKDAGSHQAWRVTDFPSGAAQLSLWQRTFIFLFYAAYHQTRDTLFERGNAVENALALSNVSLTVYVRRLVYFQVALLNHLHFLLALFVIVAHFWPRESL